MQRLTDEQREQANKDIAAMQATADTMQKLISTPEWKAFVREMEVRAQALMKALLADEEGDGMKNALATARKKGAFTELNFVVGYPQLIIQEAQKLRKGAEDKS